MDPVNKWLTTIIIFMIVLILTVFYTGGSQRYEFLTSRSILFPDSTAVYVLDTKTGKVYGKIVNESDMTYAEKPSRDPSQVFEVPSYMNSGYRKY
jgi:hypothetical protein